MITFNKIVNKLLRKWWNVIFKEDIFEIVDPEKKEKYIIKVDKIIYRLKAEKIIIGVKSGVYIIPSNEDIKLNKIDLIDKYFFLLLKKYITFHVWSSYYISWQKSLEFHLKDYSVPEKIFIINRKISKKIKIWSYEIIFKTISWKIEWKKINLYSKMQEFVVLKHIEDIDFKISCLELSLVESSLISNINIGVDFSLLNKTIKKYSKVLDKEKFYEIGKYKFIMSFNRLKEISKNIDKDLYEIFLDIIKINWGLFIWEWLRGF